MTPMMAKVDLTQNESLSELAKEKISKYNERTKHYVPLRVSKTITLMVPPEKCTEEHKEKFIRKINAPFETTQTVKTKVQVDIEEVRRLLAEGRTKKDIAKIIGVSSTTLTKHLKEAEKVGVE